MDRDLTDHTIERWAKVKPDVALGGLQVTARLARLGHHVAVREEEVFGRFGLNRGEVGVLGALRIVGPPHRLSPTRLGKGLMLSSAGMTSRLDRLERRGLITRLPDPADRRGVIVELTEDGRELVDTAVGAHAAVERQLLSGLDADEIAALESLLRKMLARLEPAEVD